MKKRITTIFMFVVLSIGLMACKANNSPAVENEDAVEVEEETGNPEMQILKIGTQDTPINGKNPFYQLQEFLDEEIRKETEGRYGLELYHSGQIGNERELLENVMMGTMEITTANASAFENISDVYAALNMPFLVRSYDDYVKIAKSDIMKDMGESLADHNLVCLGTALGGIAHISNNRNPVVVPEDLKGLKIRCMESTMMLEALNTLGAQATPMAWSEVYTGLQQNTIDGVVAVNSGYYTSKLYEVNDYLSQVGIFYYFRPVVVNKGWWEKLSTEDQEAFQRAVDAALERHYVDNKEQDDADAANLADSGMQIVTSEEVDLNAFIEAVQPMYEKYDAQYGEWLDRIIALQER